MVCDASRMDLAVGGSRFVDESPGKLASDPYAAHHARVRLASALTSHRG